MRALLFLAAVLAATAAHAQTSVFYAERGHWFVGAFGTVCRALNRPPVGLQRLALQWTGDRRPRPDGSIAADVFFWPAAITNPEPRLCPEAHLHRAETLRLPAKSIIGNTCSPRNRSVKLWRSFQDADLPHGHRRGRARRSALISVSMTWTGCSTC